jgi:hypothetical protein
MCVCVRAALHTQEIERWEILWGEGSLERCEEHHAH